MDVLEVSGVSLLGLAAYVPSKEIPNDEKVARATGIPSRRVSAENETQLEMVLKAARRVLAETSSAPEDFAAVVNVSFTQHDRMPAGACQAQARLGLPKSVLAFDVMQACAGWGYGLYLAALLVCQTGRKVLLLDGDRQSEFLDGSDEATSPLLSDGGTAAVLAPDATAARPWRFAFATDGEKGDALRLENGSTIKMDGFGVFRFVATDVVRYLKEFTSSTGASRCAWFAPHQANVYMVRQLAKAIGYDDEHLLLSADRFGNLSSASVPTTLALHGARLISAEDCSVLIAGFGGGLSVSMAELTIGADCRLVCEEGE